VTFTHAVVSPTNLHDNAYTDALSGIARRCSPFARWVFTTDARQMWLKAYCTMYDTFPAYSQLGVVINHVYSQTLAATAQGWNTWQIDLSAGNKTIEIVAGAQSGGGVIGTYPAVVYFSNAALVTESPPTAPGNRVLIYGDSIAVGDSSTYLTQQAWSVLLRQYVPVVVEAFGSRGLKTDGVDATARQAFVDRVASLSPSSIWLAIGTNDYGLNLWSAAAFGTAYADLLDKLHTALPAATIYAQTPLSRTTETANGSGSTLGDYRTQIATAQSTRSAYCQLIDGTAIMTTASLAADGVHPTIAGHALYASYVKTAMGL
jgi:lysophospholipase L1-like esterase